jgi:hypothetical protein
MHTTNIEMSPSLSVTFISHHAQEKLKILHLHLEF